MEKLPFFFYGTLRPGERNYDHLLKDRTLREETDWWLEGAQLYLFASDKGYSYLKDGVANYEPRGAYPYMIENGESAERSNRVAGHLIELRPEIYDALLAELDWLEGYSEEAAPEESEYLRVIREIRHDDGTTLQAWVYVATPQAFARQASHLTPIESGDWLVWRKQNQKS